ncbi:DUF3310 domain-containing protein [Geomicrobium sp. JCM 19038]|uniref:DUF3310 domain-containing protein n=1 Tax=Geomicrobium sp. JCM 19038 TaxID=1460635 RepID=UPI00045F2472|nr:DUF3310 domain-containing protein [Geomicrobium sp. JCM 19038]GAK08975.1 phage protein [Geomicrobium sp. JCM 19038]
MGEKMRIGSKEVPPKGTKKPPMPSRGNFKNIKLPKRTDCFSNEDFINELVEHYSLLTFKEVYDGEITLNQARKDIDQMTKLVGRNVRESEVPDLSERPSAPPKKPNMNFEDDDVNHPSHYTKGNIECLDAIEEAVPDPASYYTGNILKYMWRWQHKNGVEDLKKAQFYLNRLIESVEGKEE